MERRLAAIFAADMVGYSRLMEADETGTMERQKRHRAELIDPNFEKFNGRIVKLMGDGMLVEFGSVVDAVQCAVEIQRAMAEREGNIPDDRRIQYRIGINLGDIIIEDDDIFGDGVNIAARLEALAEPGGVCISGTTYDHLKSKVEVGYESLGDLQVKNIQQPVRAYRVLTDPEQAGANVGLRNAGSGRWSMRPIAAAVLMVTLIGAGLYWQTQRVEIASGTAQTGALALPDKPSIAVLPFENLSEDSSQVWLGDGMAEDIITDLSKVSGLFVIARNSSFQYRGRSQDLRNVGQELGVRYLLEGSVRRAGDTLRINAQLIDAASGGHLWADRYDGATVDVFALQDRVTARVVESLELVLTKTEAAAVEAPETDNPAAHDAFLQGLGHLRQRTPEDFVEARRWFDKALRIDPAHPRALGARAYLYLETAQRGWEMTVGTSGRADAIVATHAALKFPSALAYATEAKLLLTNPDTLAARAAVARGLALDPNDADLHIIAALVEAGLGNYAQAVELAEKSLRLDPRYPTSFIYDFGIVRHVAGETEAALALFDRALDRNPDGWDIRIRRAGVLGELGRTKEAAKDLEIARKSWPVRFGQFTASFIAWHWGRSYGEDYIERLTKSFVAAGLPRIGEGFDLQPENRLGHAAIKSLIGDDGVRFHGRCCGGEWMSDKYADDKRVDYWNEKKIKTSPEIVHANGAMETRPQERLGRSERCEIYSNPDGSNENLDAYVAVCNWGLFRFGVFPIP